MDFNALRYFTLRRTRHMIKLEMRLCSDLCSYLFGCWLSYQYATGMFICVHIICIITSSRSKMLVCDCARNCMLYQTALLTFFHADPASLLSILKIYAYNWNDTRSQHKNWEKV